MKKARKFLAIALAVAMTGMFSSFTASPAKASTKGTQLTIAFASTNLSNEFQVNMRKAAVAEAKAKNVKFVGSDAQGDGAKEVSQIEGFIAQKVNAIVMSPTDKDACAPAVVEAKKAGIPIIIVNCMTSNVSKANSYVGSDDAVAGRMEMQKVATALKGKGNIVILQGPTGNSATTNRMKGIKAILKKYPKIKVVASQPANWDRALGMSTMENWLQSGKKIDAVVAQNDEMALGAVKAVSAAGKLSKIKIVGIDAITDGLKAVKSGKMLATVFQNAKEQGKQSIDVAIQAAKGKTVKKDYWIAFKLVTKANVNSYLK